MSYIIVGTAGHVDHGKTLLVKALTGEDTDRLKEEKERGISIELGFAPLVLPSGARLGLVDVPGHERFIRQMLAGVAGMDLVMLVIAADEGVMPQTREHLDIIDLLQVKQGIIVITKIDLVEKEWLELVQEEVRSAVQGTVLAEAPMAAVSSVTGEGIPGLVGMLEQLAASTTARTAAGRARLPIDRVFTIMGFGTVVTGTLWSGTIRQGDPVQILPGGRLLRVRSIQVHERQVEEAVAGQRAAVNLPGIEVDEIQRGDVLAAPGSLRSSHRLDVQLHLLERGEWKLENHDRVRCYLGTSETFGRVILLDREEMVQGETAFVQLVMEEPLVAARHDRFVIRSYSPMNTIGGGVVIDPDPAKHKRFRPQVVAALVARMQGEPQELLSHALAEQKEELWSVSELAAKTGLEPEEVLAAAQGLAAQQEAVAIPGEGVTFLMNGLQGSRWQEEVRAMLAAYHKQYPLRPGLPKEELRTRKFTRLSPKAFHALLEWWQDRSIFKVKSTAISLVDFIDQPTEAQRPKIIQIVAVLKKTKFQPPTWSELRSQFGISPEEGEEILHYLSRREELVKVNEDICFSREAVLDAKEAIAAFAQEHGEIQLGEARDLLNSSRKYVLPFLEYLDRTKFTKRIGDKRVLF